MIRTGFKKETLELYTELQADPLVQENFDRIRRYLQKSLLVNFDGDGFEIEFPGDVTNLRYPHGLGFQPKDVWTTSQIGAGTITFNYELFDTENLDITVTGTSGIFNVRFIAGITVGNL